MFVQELIKSLHKKNTLALSIKFDISKVFHNINWPYLLHIIEHLGFGQRWRNCISALWNTASSSFLFNGEPGRRILHCKRVRQGDPLSPMLFLLAIEPLHKLFRKAQKLNLLGKLSKESECFRISLYADDAAVFIKPIEQDLHTTLSILNIFADASGLVTNMGKTKVYPICCEATDLSFLNSFNMAVSTLSWTYLGLSLHYKKSSKEMF
jgi:hypothetical protein